MGQSFAPAQYAALVVEDDTLLLMDAMDLVADAGLKAYGARSADEAIALMERHPEIRVLFTGVEMSGSMNGIRLAHAVRDRWPPVSIIVTSGHVRVTPDDLPAESLFFSKPYPADAIVGALTSMAGTLAS